MATPAARDVHLCAMRPGGSGRAGEWPSTLLHGLSAVEAAGCESDGLSALWECARGGIGSAAVLLGALPRSCQLRAASRQDHRQDTRLASEKSRAIQRLPTGAPSASTIGGRACRVAGCVGGSGRGRHRCVLRSRPIRSLRTPARSAAAAGTGSTMTAIGRASTAAGPWFCGRSTTARSIVGSSATRPERRTATLGEDGRRRFGMRRSRQREHHAGDRAAPGRRAAGAVRPRPWWSATGTATAAASPVASDTPLTGCARGGEHECHHCPEHRSLPVLWPRA